MQSTRVLLTPGALFRLLQGEFNRRRSPFCRSCRMPLPQAIAGVAGGLPNWRLPPIAACNERCDLLVEEIAAKMLAAYDVHEGWSAPAVRPGEERDAGEDHRQREPLAHREAEREQP